MDTVPRGSVQCVEPRPDRAKPFYQNGQKLSKYKFINTPILQVLSSRVANATVPTLDLASRAPAGLDKGGVQCSGESYRGSVAAPPGSPAGRQAGGTGRAHSTPGRTHLGPDPPWTLPSPPPLLPSPSLPLPGSSPLPNPALQPSFQKAALQSPSDRRSTNESIFCIGQSVVRV
jgi:hypothetical protein